MLVALGCSVLVSTAAAKSSSPRPLVLDTYSPGYELYTPPILSPSKLTRGRLYVATVRGSFSDYQSIDYIAVQAPWQIMCGTPQQAPMFSSAGGSGQVGNDAGFVFAQPQVGHSCAKLKLPRRYDNFQANLGHGWKHPSALGRKTLVKPSPSHTYEFALTGTGKPVSFRLIDPDTRDNYGSFQIYLRSAVRGDCGGLGHAAFGLSDKACRAATANHPAAPLPPVPKVLALDQTPVALGLRNSDVPKAVNQEVPSGALTVSQFTTLDNNSSPSAANAEMSLLQTGGFDSAAITEFAGPGLPNLKSTVVKLSSPQQALAAVQGEVTLAARDQAPAGTTAAAGPDPNLGQAYVVTFTPTSGGAGGLELIASAGDYVYTLRAVATPDTVSRPTEEQLLGAVIARG